MYVEELLHIKNETPSSQFQLDEPGRNNVNVTRVV